MKIAYDCLKVSLPVRVREWYVLHAEAQEASRVLIAVLQEDASLCGGKGCGLTIVCAACRGTGGQQGADAALQVGGSKSGLRQTTFATVSG